MLASLFDTTETGFRSAFVPVFTALRRDKPVFCPPSQARRVQMSLRWSFVRLEFQMIHIRPFHELPRSAGVTPASSDFRLPTGRRDAGVPRNCAPGPGPDACPKLEVESPHESRGSIQSAPSYPKQSQSPTTNRGCRGSRVQGANSFGEIHVKIYRSVSVFRAARTFCDGT
jgi:hypothetical protein